MPTDDANAWFALDGAGHMAAFLYGTTGPEPRAVLVDDRLIQPFDLYLHQRRLSFRTEPVLDLHGSFRPDQDSPPGRLSLRVHASSGSLGRHHIFLRGLAPVSEALHAGACRQVGSTEGLAVVFPELPSDLARRLSDSPALLGALPRPEGDIFPPDEIASLGIYVYEHLCDGWAAGPYGRIALPGTPLDLATLPEDVRSSPALTRLDGCDFARMTYLQICEWIPCVSYEAQYLASDFDTFRPIPG